MLDRTGVGRSTSAAMSAHVVVLGNEKGGSGKSTTAMHIAVALMHAGQRVATIDLDSRQRSLTHYVDNRRAWSNRARLDLDVPTHHCVVRGQGNKLDENEAAECAFFAEAVARVEHDHDFIVIDTPGSDNYLTRLAHSMADTLVTPLNDSYLDFDVLGTVDPQTFAVTGTSHYAEMVREARRQRRIVDGRMTDWIVLRNRLSIFGSRNRRLLGEGLNELSLRLCFRSVDGFAEGLVYREMFPRGLTALDQLDEATLGTRPRAAHMTAQEEVETLLAALRLPFNERGRMRASARDEWLATATQPMELDEVLAD